jgi:hypothetical protein
MIVGVLGLLSYFVRRTYQLGSGNRLSDDRGNENDHRADAYLSVFILLPMCPHFHAIMLIIG